MHATCPVLRKLPVTDPALIYAWCVSSLGFS